MNLSLKISLLFLGTCNAGIVHSQSTPDYFILGMYGCDKYIFDSDGFETSPENSFGFNSSFQNVVAEDGFNTIFTYYPDCYFNDDFLRAYLTLAKNNNLKVFDYTSSFYKPYPFASGGENQYNANPAINNVRFNVDKAYEDVYADPLLANTIQGHTLGGEHSFFHAHAKKDSIPSSCQDSVTNAAWELDEMPPQNLSDALLHFKAKRASLNLNNQKLVYSCAVHGGTIQGSTDNNGVYDEEDYVFMNGVVNPQKPDIFDEGSYFSNQFREWNINANYLGKFKSIDFGKQHFSRVIAEIDIEQNDIVNPHYRYIYHSNPTIENANHLWFQTYTSIIHGATGIIFWQLTNAYKNIPIDIANKAYIDSANNNDRFERTYTPLWYQMFVSNLGKELRYLINEGFLSTDPASIIYSKGGSTNNDPNCILPSSATYLPAAITSADARDYKAVNNIQGPFSVSNPANRRGEDYGLRYSIRTNGTEVIMIVSNPNPYSVHGVKLNFEHLANPIIRRADGVDVLFDDGLVTNVNSTSYKTGAKRSNSVDSNFDLLKKHHINFTPNEKNFLSDFGPFDVKIYKFTTPEVTFATDWVKVWSNNGNKGIGALSKISPTDKLLIGDFDNNGKEDLLCITSQSSNNIGVMQEYNETTNLWDTKWNNSGNNQLASDWPLSSSHRYYTGDFNGDNKSDILCVSGTNGWVNIYTFTSGSWVRIWTNSGSNNIGGWSGIAATDKFYVADFDGNGRDELLAIQNPTTSSNKWAVMQELFTDNLNWTWKWSNSGNDKLATDWPLSTTHRYYTEDYNGDGKADIYCVSGTNTYTNMYSFNNGFNWMWSNGGPPDNLSATAGWTLPFKPNVEILAGNIDNDSRSELMFIDEDSPLFTAQKAQTSDVNSVTGKLTPHWTNSSSGYINDWSLSKGNKTDYYLIKSSATSNKYLLALKDYASACNTPNYLVSLYKVNNPAINYREINGRPDGGEITSGYSELKDVADFDVYPNPNNGLMQVKITNDSGQDGVLVLYSMQGISIASYVVREGECRFDIDQSHLADGTYYFNLVLTTKVNAKKKITISK